MQEPPSAPELALVVVGGPAMDVIELDLQKQRTAGRSSDCDVVLNDPSISRVHAEFGRDADGVFVSDMESGGGVFVNRVRLEAGGQERLANRDLVVMGPWSMLVRLASDAKPEPNLEETESPAEAPSGNVDASREDAMYATRASIFIRLRSDGTLDREVGWNEFTEKYSRVIAGFARNAGLRSQDADDVLQDVLMGFFRVSADFTYDPAKGRFRGYLKRVTLNAIRSRYRRRRPDRNIDPEWEPPALDQSTDAIWDRQWTEQLLNRAMDKVRLQVEDRTWKAFELYGMRGTAVEAVADETGMSVEAIRHAKMRITKQIREIVNVFREEEG